MAAYSEERFNLRGIETVVQIAGEGDPLVFLHGAGTVTGFDARARGDRAGRALVGRLAGGELRR